MVEGRKVDSALHVLITTSNSSNLSSGRGLTGRTWVVRITFVTLLIGAAYTSKPVSGQSSTLLFRVDECALAYIGGKRVAPEECTLYKVNHCRTRPHGIGLNPVAFARRSSIVVH